MKVFCYFVEPASYTLDLARNIYDKSGVDYCFINSNTSAFTNNLTSKPFLDSFSFFRKLYYVFLQFERNNFIIINGYNNFPFILTFFFNIFSFNKKFIAIDSDTQLSVPNNLLRRLVKWLYLSVIFRSKYVFGFAGGNNTHKDLFRYYGMNEKRIFLMPMMVDNKKYYTKTKKLPDVFTFLFVGRLIKTKNVDILCEKFINSFANKNAKLIIVGGGDRLRVLKQEFSHPQIEFKGSVFGHDLINLYHNSSVFVFPSSLEAWGLVVNEAMSAALPVISHALVGANYDLLHNKDTGMIASDMEDFGSKMHELFNNSELLLKFSKNASSLMRNYWNYDLYERCFFEVIKRVSK